MGMSASQVRYLSLTARKSDLEHQAQTISYARIELATKSAEISAAYTQGMNNKVIRISHLESNGSTSSTVWEQLNFENALNQNYKIIGTDGKVINPSPYKQYAKDSILTEEEYNALPESEKAKCSENYTVNSNISIQGENGNAINYAQGAEINAAEYAMLSDTDKENCTSTKTYKANSHICALSSNYTGYDAQTLLMSGIAQIANNEFYQFLCDHGYGTGELYETNAATGEKTPKTYEELVQQYNSTGKQTTVDWTADISSTFNETMYTEDDDRVSADYEAATAELAQKDKKLELQLKNIETQHKAAETELDSVAKVLKENIEKSFKSFNA